MHKVVVKVVLAAVILAASSGVIGQGFQMDRLETQDLQLLYFDPPQTYLVPHVGRSFHNSLDFQREVFDWTPYDKTTVLLKDFTDYGNAAARSSPNNALIIDVAPLSRTFETFTASERIFALMNHELVHVATMDVWNERDAAWRKFFAGKPLADGKNPLSIIYNYLATPRVAVPRWYLEGSAVFMETWMAGGLGRAQGAYDEMVFRAMVRDDAHFYGPLGLVSKGTQTDFQVGVNAYLYGTRFISFLALEYTPEQVVEWLSRGEGSEAYYSTQFRQVFGKTLEQAWDEWISWERDFQEANLASLQRYPLTKISPLTDEGLGSVSRAFIGDDGQSLVGAFRYPGVLAHIGEIPLDGGESRRIVDIKGPMLYRVTAPAHDAANNRLFYTSDNYNFRDLMAVDLDTGESEMLIRDARIGELVYNTSDKVLWGVRHLNGYATLVKLPPPYTTWSQVHTFDYGQILYDMDISPDGRQLSTSMGEVNGDQFLRVFDLAQLSTGDIVPKQQFDFGQAVPEGFVFSPDGKYLFGSSYYTGVSNIFRFEVATGDIEAVSNSETGLFRPIPLQDGRLLAFEFTGTGFRPGVFDPDPIEDLGNITFLGAEVAREHEVVRGWQVGSPAEVPLDDLVTARDKYTPWRELGLESAYPILESYKDEAAFGWQFNFADTMQFNRLFVSGSYSPSDELPKSERAHFDIRYETINWYAQYRRNGADFYDFFGPTERSRRGNAFFLGTDRSLIYDLPRKLDLNVEIARYTGLDQLPNAQNIAADFEELTSLKAVLEYSHTRRSLGAVDHENGIEADLAVLSDHITDGTFNKVLGGFNFGFKLPWNHASIWLYNNLGVADGDEEAALGPYYFGAFGNNYVDKREVKRYREYYSFPGFDINEIAAMDFGKVVAELNLPPWRFEEVGIPSFYLQHLRPAIFTSVLNGDVPGADRRTYTNAGFQLDLSFTIVHRLPMVLSLGYAVGYEEGDRAGDEWVVSLKVL